MNTARWPTCWSTLRSATASRSSCRKPGPKGRAKPSWLHYVCNEVRDAHGPRRRRAGHLLVPDHGLPGLGQQRHAETGLLSSVVADGTRHVDQRLLEELEVQRARFGSPAS